MSSGHQIGLLGVGAIGSVVASYLLEANQSVHFFNRSPRSQLRIRRQAGWVQHRIHCQTSPSNHQALNYLIICLKEHHFATAQYWFRSLISPTTKIVIIRNGLQLKAPLLAYCRADQILECMIDCPVQALPGGAYQQFKKPIIISSATELARTFQSLFLPQAIQFDLVSDFKTASWIKLCESTSIGAITCLSGEACWVFKDPEVLDLYKRLLEECMAVALADGANMPGDYLETSCRKVQAYPADKGSSMLTDRLAGRAIELGAKSGVVSKIGKQYGIPTPLNNLVVALLKWTNR